MRERFPATSLGAPGVGAGNLQIATADLASSVVMD